MSIMKKCAIGIILIFLISLNLASAQMDMETGSETTMNSMTATPLQDSINRVSYPVTAIVALLSLVVCFSLIKATGMKDKFGMIALGLIFFLIQSILGVLYYATTPKGLYLDMPNLMFTFSVLSSLGLLSIGIGFYKWQQMIVE